ncbi:LysR substrate-binding domain-containing protein [Streptomyces sp. NBC_01515]|uniref:LysR substrate-binding domain-containing protein n=1 Tax=Streptomyces sp. NBC_01515 TaxID=2903890 RepID=UPI003864BD48
MSAHLARLERAGPLHNGPVSWVTTAGRSRKGDRRTAPRAPAPEFPARASVTWNDLARQPFVAFTPSSSVRRLADLSFEQAGVRPTNVIETREVGTAAGMISAGLGVSAVPRLVLPLMSFGRLVTRPLNDPGTVRKLAVYTPRTPVLPPASAYFLHRLLHTAGAEHDGPVPGRSETGEQGDKGERRA